MDGLGGKVDDMMSQMLEEKKAEIAVLIAKNREVVLDRDRQENKTAQVTAKFNRAIERNDELFVKHNLQHKKDEEEKDVLKQANEGFKQDIVWYRSMLDTMQKEVVDKLDQALLQDNGHKRARC